MPFNPKVSVIVPVFNAEKTIEECIESLLAMDYERERVELICVNNASTDKTSDILDGNKEKIDKLLFEQTRGPGAARNKALAHATGEIVALTDSDCVVEKNWLRNIVVPLQDEGIGIVGGQILATRPCNEIEVFGEYIHDQGKAINAYKPPYCITMNWASRLSVLNKLGLFDESYMRCEDVELSYRIWRAGYKLTYEPKAIIYHRNESTLSGIFREGYLHGFYGIRLLKAWKEVLFRLGHRRINSKSYAEIGSALVKSLRGVDKSYNKSYVVFNVGKKIGKMIGSVRFSHFDV